MRRVPVLWVLALSGCVGMATGERDAGGTPLDSGVTPAVDGGTSDAGPPPDAGIPSRDGGTPPVDAGSSDTTPCDAELDGGVMLSPGTPLAQAVVPNPILSLHRPVTTTTSGYDATQLFLDPPNPNNVSNLYGVGWQPAPGESVTLDVGTGPSSVLMTWEVAYPDYLAQSAGFGLPYSYEIDTSPDGTTWTSAVPTTSCNYRSREVVLAFAGM